MADYTCIKCSKDIWDFTYYYDTGERICGDCARKIMVEYNRYFPCDLSFESFGFMVTWTQAEEMVRRLKRDDAMCGYIYRIPDIEVYERDKQLKGE